MKKVLILEDNRKTLLFLEMLVKEIDDNLVVHGYSNAKDAYECILCHKIDLFMVDIILDTKIAGDVSGLYFSENVRRIKQYQFVPLILITSLYDPKCVAYEELHCYSFIEKPFDPERVRKTVKECLEFPGGVMEPKRMYLKSDGVMKSIILEDVVYVESILHGLYIHKVDGSVIKVQNMKLTDFIRLSDRPFMIQCRRNTVINKNYVKNIDHVNGVIQFMDDRRVEIGISFKASLKETFV